MNILFEIADKDIMFIGFFGVGIVLFGVIIFYVLSRSEKKGIKDEPLVEEEPIEKREEFFEDIKPSTKEQQEAKDELERVFKQMSEDLEEKEPSSKTVRDFEREQEENAIISYQELIKQAEAKRNNPLKDLAELEEMEEVKEKPKKDVKKDKNFISSEIISPIFGTQKPEEYKEDMRKKKKDLYEDTTNLEFLKNLKDFRDNL